jgi:tetratricopeptide (TPR) repeat protein
VGLTLLALFFSILADSFLLGIFIACFFFTLVLYFVLRLYFQEQKASQFQALRDEFLAHFQHMPEVAIEQAQLIAQKLLMSDMAFFDLPSPLAPIKPYFEKLCRLLLWQDIHLFGELFLKKCLDIKLQQVMQDPADPINHAELATQYMAMANHFSTFIPKVSPNAETMKRFESSSTSYSRLALVELEIVQELNQQNRASHDPQQGMWLHSKLAENYLLLGQKEKAIQEYETLLEESPDDVDLLSTLGSLYFKQGMNGKGLKMHEKLSSIDPLKAKSLIALYGSV